MLTGHWKYNPFFSNDPYTLYRKRAILLYTVYSIQGNPKKKTTVKNHYKIVFKTVCEAKVFLSFEYKMGI